MAGLKLTSVPGVGLLGATRAFADSGSWVSNDDIHALLYGDHWKSTMVEQGLDPEHPRRKGFSRRHWTLPPESPRTGDEENSADLMHRAAREVLLQTGVNISEIDLFIAVSTTSPRYTSSLGTLVAGLLGYRGATFEMKSGCSSTIYAISVAYQFLAGPARSVLIASAETLSRVISRDGPFLYAAGDGAGALILQKVKDPQRGLLAGFLDSDGSYADAMGVPGILPPIREALDQGLYFMGQSANLAADVRPRWMESQEAIIDGKERTMDDIDLYIPHQTSSSVLDMLSDSMGSHSGKLYRCLDRFGNCGSATIPIALSEALEDGFSPGRRILLNAVGGGLAWGSLLISV